jgi:hypothetical protein
MDKKLFAHLKDIEESINTKLLDPKRIISRPVGTTVCKYWLENRCKKGENCEFLHEKILDKLPECQYGTMCPRLGECPFKHTPRMVKECPYYMNGYCKDGNILLT